MQDDVRLAQSVLTVTTGVQQPRERQPSVGMLIGGAAALIVRGQGPAQVDGCGDAVMIAKHIGEAIAGFERVGVAVAPQNERGAIGIHRPGQLDLARGGSSSVQESGLQQPLVKRCGMRVQ
ncbi:hypothetical protein [Actinoplanes flavus]|uniref:Uncharacterized protein n=1 Tax=Actinoplanes flavus TaxID=2820290 RepID=A0ABS3UD44_9ACTN|nr:hypothetical protein [Actinoplanes flavus]MBO3736701.1 hypothetical protein [Actinoplanes flavus]